MWRSVAEGLGGTWRSTCERKKHVRGLDAYLHPLVAFAAVGAMGPLEVRIDHLSEIRGLGRVYCGTRLRHRMSKLGQTDR
jgi:hypothetical protein